MSKRAIDILISFIAITLLFPLMIIVSVLVYFKLGSPIFFTQERPGFNGKIFKMFKFRSMLNSTDISGKLLSDEERLTSFGKTLRSTSLDELPGLLNVLKGDMSIVGPRPLLVEYLPLYNKRQSKRHNVRPGITGWAQVNGRNAISWEEKFELDAWYIENQSLLLDLKIIFMTVEKVFKRADISSEVNVTMEKFIGSIKEELFMEDIVIIGAGGVGREIAWLIEQINNVKATFNILGFIDDNYELHGKNINGYKVFGGTDYLLTMDQNINVVCAIANYKVKKRIIEKLSLRQFHYPTIIHPEVYISNTNTVGKGCVIYPGVIITTNIRLGDYVIISPKCGIGHEAVIEDYSSILWNVSISGNVKIEEGCLIGSGATIIQGKNIGRESIVGAGAVVVKDIPEKCTAVGVPAKVVKFNQ